MKIISRYLTLHDLQIMLKRKDLIWEVHVWTRTTSVALTGTPTYSLYFWQRDRCWDCGNAPSDWERQTHSPNPSVVSGSEALTDV